MYIHKFVRNLEFRIAMCLTFGKHISYLNIAGISIATKDETFQYETVLRFVMSVARFFISEINLSFVQTSFFTVTTMYNYINTIKKPFNLGKNIIEFNLSKFEMRSIMSKIS